MISLRSCLRYLVSGSDELYLPASWLEDRDRMRAYVGYTRRQHQQGSIVADVNEMRRRAFWEAQAAKREAGTTVKQFPRKVAG